MTTGVLTTRTTSARPVAVRVALPVLLLLLAFLATGPTAQASAAEDTSGASLAATSGLLFGAYAGRRSEPTGTDVLESVESAAGRKLDLRREYLRWDNTLPSALMKRDVQRGRTTAVSVNALRLDGSKVSWAAIAAGQLDADITVQARALAGLGAPVLLTLHHEPELAVGFGTAADYVAAWRHYVEVFRANGATNVAFNWIMTLKGFSPTSPTADAWYPGDDVVDWMAVDAFNFAGCAAGQLASWRSLADLVTNFRSWALPHAKALMLAEFGSVEDATDPNRKAQWLRDAMTTLGGWPEFKAASYLNAVGSCPWWLDSSPASFSAYTAIANSATAHGRTSAELRTDTLTGPAPLTVTFDADASTGAGSPTGTGIASWSVDAGDGTPVVTGVGTPPAVLPHVYAAGTFSASLQVTDGAGRTARDTRSVVAVGAPVVIDSESGVSSTSATLRGWITAGGLAATVTFEWAPGDWSTTGATPTRSAPVAIAAGSPSVGINNVVSGLLPGTYYSWRTVTTSAGGTTTAPVRRIDTPGAPTPLTLTVNGRSALGATLNGSVNPHSLDSTYWYEFGTTTSYGTRTVVSPLAAATWARTANAVVVGLQTKTVYHYRLVSQNSLGTVASPDVTFTTL